MLTILARLVAFDTVSSKTNLQLIDYVETLIRAHGLAPVRLPNTEGDKAALMVTIGPADRPGIVLSGHTDVVPVTGQVWTVDPFALRVAEGRAYGRGAVDMKGFLALCLAAIPAFKARARTMPVHLLFSYDEETSCLGSLDGIARFGRDLPAPRAVIVGEPTGLEVADAHKSVVTFDTRVHGFECHSSKPDLGANAILGAALLVTELGRIADDMKALGDPTGRFDPPCTTVHVGEFHGGTARNIVPKLARFHWEYRGVPGLDSEALVVGRLDRFARGIVEPRLRATGHPAHVETVNEVRVPGLAPEAGSPAETLALAVAGRNRTVSVPYGTEAGAFQGAGIPTIVCGPGLIDQAHQPDEFITLAALADGARFMERLAERLSG